MPVQTLLRDNYRCAFTGAVDYASEASVPDLDDGYTVAFTNVAHIISQSITEEINPDILPRTPKVCVSEISPMSGNPFLTLSLVV